MLCLGSRTSVLGSKGLSSTVLELMTGLCAGICASFKQRPHGYFRYSRFWVDCFSADHDVWCWAVGVGMAETHLGLLSGISKRCSANFALKLLRGCSACQAMRSRAVCWDLDFLSTRLPHASNCVSLSEATHCHIPLAYEHRCEKKRGQTPRAQHIHHTMCVYICICFK